MQISISHDNGMQICNELLDKCQFSVNWKRQKVESAIVGTVSCQKQLKLVSILAIFRPYTKKVSTAVYIDQVWNWLVFVTWVGLGFRIQTWRLLYWFLYVLVNIWPFQPLEMLDQQFNFIYIYFFHSLTSNATLTGNVYIPPITL